MHLPVSAQQLGPDERGAVVVGQPVGGRAEDGEAGHGSRSLAHGDRAVEPHDGRPGERLEPRVAACDRGPVRVGSRRGGVVERRDERLEAQLLGETITRRERAQASQPGVDLVGVPPAPVLVHQADESAVRSGPGVTSRVLQGEEGGERLESRPTRQELCSQAGQPQGVARLPHPDDLVSAGRGVPGREGEVDRARHVVEPVRPAVEVRDDERHPARGEPRLGTGEPRSHGRGRHEEEARDVGRRHAEDEPQRERRPHLGGEHRVRGHEEERQTLVDVLPGEVVPCAVPRSVARDVVPGLVLGEEVRRGLRRPFSAERVDDPAACDRADPARRVVGDARRRPLRRRIGEGLGERVLDEVGPAEAVHELSEQPPPLGAPDLGEGTLRHQEMSTVGAIWMSYGGRIVRRSTRTSMSGASTR